MFRLTQKMKVFLLAVIVSHGAFAYTGEPAPGATLHEVEGDAFARMRLNSGTTIDLGGSYNYLVSHGVQVGIRAGWNHSSGSDAIAALVGPTINFPFTDHLNDAYFASALFGVNYASKTAGSTTDFAFMIELGKRCPLWGNVSLKPFIGLSKVGSGDVTFVIEPFALTALF